jgi:hypothetical protein
VGGVLTPVAEPQRVVVEPLALATLPEKDRPALLAFQKKAGELQRAVMGTVSVLQETTRGVQFMKKAVLDAPKADAALAADLVAFERKLRAAMTVLVGDRVVQRRSEASSPSLADRISAQLGSTSPITATAKRDYELAAAAFEKALPEMRTLIDGEFRKLGERLEAAGAPWTPGRGLPMWKR